MKAPVYKCEHEGCAAEVPKTEHLILCGTIFRFCSIECRYLWQRAHMQIATQQGLRRIAVAKESRDGA